jgi:hypothetical protein
MKPIQALAELLLILIGYLAKACYASFYPAAKASGNENNLE